VGALGDDSGGTAGDDMVSGGDIATWNPDTGIGTLDDMLSDLGVDNPSSDIISSDDPLRHQSAADAGSGTEASADDHVHPGMPFYQAGSLSALNTANPPDGDGTPDPVIPINAIAFLEDLMEFYNIRTVSAVKYWVPVSKSWKQTSAPSSIGEADGDLWYDSTNHRPYQRFNGAWEGLAWRKTDNKLYYYDDTADRLVSHWE